MIFFAVETKTLAVPYYKDLLRATFLIFLSIILLFYATLESSLLNWIKNSLFVPLSIIPALLIRDIDVGRLWFISDFFSGYSLQAFQHNTSSLGTWLIVPFGILTPLLFKNHSPKRFLMLFFLLVATMGLIWWTNSRGTILAALLIMIGSGLFAKWRYKITFLKLFILLFAIPSLGLFILPQQAQAAIFSRFYPQFTESVKKMNYYTPLSIISKNVFSSQPNFLHAQNRQILWVEYTYFIITHPLGQYGPTLPFLNKKEGTIHNENEHNTILQVGLWGGWGAIIVFVYLLYKIFLSTLKNIHYTPSNTFLIGLFMAFLGVLLLSFLNSFFQLKILWFLVTILMAYSIHKTNKTKSFS